jgi:amidase
MHDPLNAFCRHVEVRLPGAPGGPLSGLDFAAKDIFDVAGEVCCCGNPDFLARARPAARTASSVAALVASGAGMIGKTLTDEFAFSLNGENFHYGAPVNSAAPGRIAGGSSCGSAAAVAGGLADFALGSDTGGSVRVPASLCGLFGMRPSHGRVGIDGVMKLAPSFDTVGWFARDAGVLGRVGSVLLGEDRVNRQGAGLMVPEDAFALADDAVRQALAPALAAAAAELGGRREMTLGEDLGALMLCFRHLQSREIWAELGPWIEATRPGLGPEIAARFDFARSIALSPPGDEGQRRETFTAKMDGILSGAAALALPSAPTIAPRLNETPENLRSFRDRTLSLTCIAGLARLPQVSIPAGRVDGCPVGLSLVAPRGADRWLLDLARRVAARL